MSSKAPMLSNEKITEAFTKAQEDSNFGFMQITIDLDKSQFELKKVETTAGSDKKNWEKMCEALEEGNHSYLVTRDPVNPKLFVLVHWGPDLSSVRQRTIYASSRATLKGQLGSASFAPDYYINHKEECNEQKLITQRTLHEKIDFRSDSEIEKQLASIESAPKTAQSAVMQRLPVEIASNAQEGLQKYLNEQCKLVIFKLSEDKKSITAEEHKDDSIEAIRAALPDNEPRYFVFWHTRVRPDEKNSEAPTARVFGFYCPENCDRSLKFTYSTCKGNVMDYCTQIKLEFDGKVELTDKREFTHEFLDYHVFPVLEEKQTFETPKPAGRKKTTKRQKVDVE